MVSMDVSHKMNQNLTAPQRELMLWHLKWAHCDMERVQILLAKPREEAIDQLIKPNHDKPLSLLGVKTKTAVRSNPGSSEKISNPQDLIIFNKAKKMSSRILISLEGSTE
jgi:hypothetical protein